MRLILIGFGTVGQGLAELLLAKKGEHAFTVVGIADPIKGTAYAPAGLDLAEALQRVKTHASLHGLGGTPCPWDSLHLISHAEADVCVEMSPTDLASAEPATSHLHAAFARGMHVVTTNKGPIARHYHELAALARHHGVELLFEGTVMSGTPVLNLVRDTLAGSRILTAEGILNGTCNFILSQMEKGHSYEAALGEAQALGYAETVPDADVLGWDTVAKVTILANVLFGAHLSPSDVTCQGITGITAEDVAHALSTGRRYKLIGRVWHEGETVHAAVAPRLVDFAEPLAFVMGVTNALTLQTDALGMVTISGPGAGRRETGFAVLSDLLHLARDAGDRV